MAVLRRVDDEVAVELADPDRADQLLHRDRRDRQCGRGAVHREDVVGVHVIDRERHRDELRLEVPALREQRPDRPVDHTGGKGGLLAGTRLAPEVGAGDAANCVVALLDVDGQGQEVDIAEVAHRRGAEHHRVATADDDGAARLAGHLAGLERDLLAADLDGDSTHVKHAHMYFVFLPLGASRAWLRETVSRPMTSPARFRLLCLSRRLHVAPGNDRSTALIEVSGGLRGAGGKRAAKTCNLRLSPGRGGYDADAAPRRRASRASPGGPMGKCGRNLIQDAEMWPHTAAVGDPAPLNGLSSVVIVAVRGRRSAPEDAACSPVKPRCQVPVRRPTEGDLTLQRAPPAR